MIDVDVLSTAAGLKEFDAATVAAYCQAEEDRVILVLDGHPDLFAKRIPRHQAYPASPRYRVLHPDALARRISSFSTTPDFAPWPGFAQTSSSATALDRSVEQYPDENSTPLPGMDSASDSGPVMDSRSVLNLDATPDHEATPEPGPEREVTHQSALDPRPKSDPGRDRDLLSGKHSGATLNPEPALNRDPTLNPGPTLNRDPALNPDLTLNPDPALNPDPTLKPDPTANPGPALKPDPTANPGPALKPDPTLNPGPSNEHAPEAARTRPRPPRSGPRPRRPERGDQPSVRRTPGNFTSGGYTSGGYTTPSTSSPSPALDQNPSDAVASTLPPVSARTSPAHSSAPWNRPSADQPSTTEPSTTGPKVTEPSAPQTKGMPATFAQAYGTQLNEMQAREAQAERTRPKADRPSAARPQSPQPESHDLTRFTPAPPSSTQPHVTRPAAPQPHQYPNPRQAPQPHQVPQPTQRRLPPGTRLSRPPLPQLGAPSVPNPDVPRADSDLPRRGRPSGPRDSGQGISRAYVDLPSGLNATGPDTYPSLLSRGRLPAPSAPSDPRSYPGSTDPRSHRDLPNRSPNRSPNTASGLGDENFPDPGADRLEVIHGREPSREASPDPRLSHAESTLLACARESDPQARHALASAAMSALSECVPNLPRDGELHTAELPPRLRFALTLATLTLIESTGQPIARKLLISAYDDAAALAQEFLPPRQADLISQFRALVSGRSGEYPAV